MVGRGKLKGECLRCGLVVATFRVEAEKAHLVFDLLADLFGRGEFGL